MDFTEHDLSYDQTKLDFEALSKSTTTGFNALCRLIDTEHNRLRAWNSDKPRATNECYYAAKALKGYTDSLVVIAETMHVLEEARSRTKIEIVNKARIPTV